MPKGVKLGPRVTVLVGKGKTGKAVYSYMLKSVADNFGFKPEAKIPQSKSKKGHIVVKRGSMSGASAIKVPKGKNAKTPKGNQKYVSIPLPGGMTIPKTQEFLKKATKNKPEYFVTADGRTFPI